MYLLGSERVDSIGVIGDRFKEGVNINKFLLVLGNVIFVLVDLFMGKKKVMVSYRDFVFIKLFQNVLGGNSKIIMIVALFLVDINYDEILGILRCCNFILYLKLLFEI